MIHRLSGPGSLDGGHGLRVGQNLHLLQKAGHPFARHNKSHHFPIPGDGGSLSPPAQGGKLRLSLRHRQRILHSELYIDHLAQNGKLRISDKIPGPPICRKNLEVRGMLVRGMAEGVLRMISLTLIPQTSLRPFSKRKAAKSRSRKEAFSRLCSAIPKNCAFSTKFLLLSVSSPFPLRAPVQILWLRLAALCLRDFATLR